MTKRKTSKASAEPDVLDPHEELAFQAAFFVERLIPDAIQHFNLCPLCFGREIIRQLEEAITNVETSHEPGDSIGSTEGNA